MAPESRYRACASDPFRGWRPKRRRGGSDKMSALIQGPAWGVSGTSGAVVLNPLRVENSIFAVVDRLLPGVISTTPHARYLGLHGLLRMEAGSHMLESA